MTTVADLLRDALGHIKVLDAAEAIEAEDARDGIRALNLMMTRWEASGLALGWKNVSSPEDALPLPLEAEEAVGAHLAIRLVGRYGQTLDASVIEMANDGLARLRADVASRDGARLRYDDLPAGVNGAQSDFNGGG